jgi:HEAT repeat protein
VSPVLRAPGPRKAGCVAALAVFALTFACAPERDVETLFRQLRSSDMEARQEATEQLAELVHQGKFDVFVRGLDNPDRLYRAQSMIYLSQIQKPEARAALRELLRVDRRSMLPFNPIRLKPAVEETDSRILVANLLAQTGGDPEALAVLTAGTDGQDAKVLADTCFAIGALHDPKGIPYLATQARHPDTSVVRAAVQALGRFRDRDVLAAVRPLLKHPALEVRMDVLGTLDLQDSPETGKLLEEIGSSDPSPEIRASAIQQLARSRDPSVVPYLIERLGARDEMTKRAAQTVLGTLTGQSLGPRAEAWSRWWERSGKTLPGSALK